MTKNNSKNLIGVLVIILIIGGVYFFYWNTNKTSTNNNQLPNPASVYCENQGGKLETREDTNGNQYGVCIFANGNECEEWAFYRGECSQNDCVKQGGYCAEECKKGDGIVYLKGCSSRQICCMPMPKESTGACKDLCGDGICQEVVCMAIGCPCAETRGSCPQDCK